MAAPEISAALRSAADLLEREGWDAWRDGLDVMNAVTRVTDDDDDLVTDVWFSIIARLGGRALIAWQREPGRTKAEVVAMLRTAADQQNGGASRG